MHKSRYVIRFWGRNDPTHHSVREYPCRSLRLGQGGWTPLPTSPVGTWGVDLSTPTLGGERVTTEPRQGHFYSICHICGIVVPPKFTNFYFLYFVFFLSVIG